MRIPTMVNVLTSTYLLASHAIFFHVFFGFMGGKGVARLVLSPRGDLLVEIDGGLEGFFIEFCLVCSNM